MPVGVIIVGVGFIAGVHVAAIERSAGAELRGVVDADGERAADFSYSHGGIPFTTDLAEALAWADVQAVIICTPNSTHSTLGLQVAAAGKHLLVEKPLATTVTDAEQLEQAFAAAGKVLMAAHTHRFYDYGRSVKDCIEAGELGQPTFARLAILGSWIWPDWNAWMIDPQKSGGHALHNGVHLLDLVSWWLQAEPVEVYARGQRQTASELEIYDYLEMSLTFDNGAGAVCEMSRAHRTGTVNQRELMVLGTDGMIEQDFDGDSALVITEGGIQLIPTQAQDGFLIQVEAWLDAISGEPPAMTAAEGVRAVALGVAVEESIRIGQPVRIDRATEGVPQ